MLTLQFFILIFAIAMNVVLLVAIYKRNPKSDTHRLFAALGVVVTCWLIASYLSSTPETNLMWSRLTIFFAAAMTLLLFFFVHTLPQPKFSLSRIKATIALVSTAAVMLVTISPFAFVGVEEIEGDISLVVGPGMGAFGSLSVFFSMLSVYLLWRKFKKAKGIEKEQIRYVLAGVGLMLGLLIVTVLLPTVLFRNDFFVSFIPFYALIFLGMSAYAIARYRMLDIRLIIARSISYTAVVALVALAYVAVVFLTGTYLFKVDFDIRTTGLAVLFAAVVALTFERLHGFIAQVSDRIFFQGRYKPDVLLKEIGRMLAETLELKPLTKKLSALLSSELRVERAAFAIDEGKRNYAWYGKGSVDKKTLGELMKLDAVAVADELPEGQVKTMLMTLEVAAAVPLKTKDKRIGVFLVGQKLSGEPLGGEDVSFLEVAAFEMAIGFQNAQSYAQIKRFSEELEGRVKERTQELEASQKQELAKAQEVAKLKDEFVFLAVHELRTPIVAIRGFLELTQAAQKTFPKDVARNLAAITDASAHMQQLVNDLLEIARSESSTLKVELAANAFGPVVDTVLKEVASLAEQKKVSIEKRIEIKEPVLCDPAKLKEVLENLLGNAIKYNREEGTVFVHAYRPAGQDFMMCEVRDTGFGIPKDKQEKIFQKFFRAVTPETQEITGTGLGLFITRMLVEKMGGRVMFSSVEHEGTTFSFTLPLAKSAAQPL